MNRQSIALLRSVWDTDENDIFICTHQKVGTHLTKKFVVEILRHAFPYHEQSGMAAGDIGHATVPWPEVMVSQHGIKAFEEHLKATQGQPRVWYTHCDQRDLPFRSIHPKSKFIFTFRDPKGAAVSQYYFYKSHPLLRFPDNIGMDAFVDLFLSGNLYFGDYHQHTREWMAGCMGSIHPGQLLTLHYEDLVQDKFRKAVAINSFLMKDHMLGREQIERVVASTEFNTMKQGIIENPGSFHFNPNTFFRSGKTNDWVTQLSDESILKIDSKTESVWSDSLLVLDATRA
ncbi:MAG: sulfotransferase domain-containing protein [Bacteroidota bacterium]